jgi:two-component system nitrate/nitrite response regulator NarL
MSPAPIRLFLIDDHALFRESIAYLLSKEVDIDVAGQSASATAALEQIVASGANMALLDLELGPERATDFVNNAGQVGYRGRILVLTEELTDHDATELVRAGVAGIIRKQKSAEDLLTAIRQVAAGEVWMERRAGRSSLTAKDRRVRGSKRPPLTERDKAVLRLLLQGLSNREMAWQLDISEGALKSSVRYVCDKLHVRTRAQVVKVAIEELKDQL